jgi:hypothetical protein
MANAGRLLLFDETRQPRRTVARGAGTVVAAPPPLAASVDP